MRIANPIYDAVFKYLMTSDIKVAKLIISSLINKPVLELTVDPTEIVINKDRTSIKKESLTVFRLDFAAKIREDDGTERLIIIELQKAKFISDIMRFRKYLGAQYMKKTHIYKINGSQIPLPIYPIYILGHKLDNFDEEAIYIKREFYNAITNQKLTKRNNIFIDGLTHDGLIIQIPRVNQRIEDKNGKINRHLKELLAIFDQTKHDDDSEHFLEVDRDSAPVWLKPVLRELEKAAADAEVRNKMQLEDDYIGELEDLERTIENRDKIIEVKDKAIEQEKNRANQEQQRAEAAERQVAELKALLQKIH
jgi:hypothetical protein